MEKKACDVIDYCPFCGKKESLETIGEGFVKCTNTKCETEPFLIQGGVKARE